MTGTVGLNDTTTATSSAAHASTAHGHGDLTPPREAAPPVVRAGASRSDRTIAVHTGVRMLSQLHARPKLVCPGNPDSVRKQHALGSLDTYRIHKMMAARAMTAR